MKTMRKLLLLSAAAAWIGGATAVFGQSYDVTALAESHVTERAYNTLAVDPPGTLGASSLLVATIVTADTSLTSPGDALTESDTGPAQLVWQSSVGTDPAKKSFTGLSPNTKYDIHFEYWIGGVRSTSSVDDVYTLPATPTSPTTAAKAATHESLTFAYSSAGSVPDDTQRILYAFKSALSTSDADADDFPDAAAGRATSFGLSGPSDLKSSQAVTGSLVDFTITGLEAGTAYHVYVVDVGVTSDWRTDAVKVGAASKTYYTAPAAATKPMLTWPAADKAKTTHATIVLTENAVPDDHTRRYLISTEDLGTVFVGADGTSHDGASSGPGQVRTVDEATARTGGNLWIGATPTPAISGSNQLNFSGLSLAANTQYWIRAYDRRKTQETAKTVLSDNMSFWTAPAKPTTYAVAKATEKTTNSVKFTGADAKPANVTRRYYASTSAALALGADGMPRDAAKGVASEGDSD